MKGKLIVFEGTDGSGKSTQFARLCERLTGQGEKFADRNGHHAAEPINSRHIVS